MKHGTHRAICFINKISALKTPSEFLADAFDHQLMDWNEQQIRHAVDWLSGLLSVWGAPAMKTPPRVVKAVATTLRAAARGETTARDVMLKIPILRFGWQLRVPVVAFERMLVEAANARRQDTT
jgi:hypothetical protein